VEQTAPAVEAGDENDIAPDDVGDELDVLLSDGGLQLLNDLHNKEAFTDPEMTLQDLPQIQANLENRPTPINDNIDEIIDDNLEMLEEAAPDTDVNTDPDPGSPILRTRDPAAVDIANILPPNARRQRRIRFNLPALR